MTKQELAQALRHNLYGDRDTIGDAFEYALDVAHAGGVYTLTALHVLMNTLANEIEKLED